MLASLAAATIAVPLVSSADDGSSEVPTSSATVADVGPSAYEVLASPPPASAPTSLLAAVPQSSRDAETVSRSLERAALPGCDGEPREGFANGRIPESDLCKLWDGDHMLRGDAAVALTELNLSYKAVFGRDLCLTDSYRTLSVQQRVAYTKPGLAARPGSSNHGWGLAIDLCSAVTRDAAAMEWLRANGPVYGWDNPPWARSGGAGAYEPWHWEYTPGTTSMGTDYS